MAKVNIKSEKITPFGGIYYASKAKGFLHIGRPTFGVHSFEHIPVAQPRLAESLFLLP